MTKDGVSCRKVTSAIEANQAGCKAALTGHPVTPGGAALSHRRHRYLMHALPSTWH